MKQSPMTTRHFLCENTNNMNQFLAFAAIKEKKRKKNVMLIFKPEVLSHLDN